jgi:hypothetical protein
MERREYWKSAPPAMSVAQFPGAKKGGVGGERGATSSTYVSRGGGGSNPSPSMHQIRNEMSRLCTHRGPCTRPPPCSPAPRRPPASAAAAPTTTARLQDRECVTFGYGLGWVGLGRAVRC